MWYLKKNGESTPRIQKLLDEAKAKARAAAEARAAEAETRKLSRGLGDTVKKITDKLGIKQCGKCKRRQELFNKAIPYKANEPKEQKG